MRIILVISLLLSGCTSSVTQKGACTENIEATRYKRIIKKRRVRPQKANTAKQPRIEKNELIEIDDESVTSESVTVCTAITDGSDADEEEWCFEIMVRK